MTVWYNAANPWPPDKIETLKKLWMTHTCKEIAHQLGVTRDAVAGKAFRLGLGSKPKVSRQKRRK